MAEIAASNVNWPSRCLLFKVCLTFLRLWPPLTNNKHNRCVLRLLLLYFFTSLYLDTLICCAPSIGHAANSCPVEPFAASCLIKYQIITQIRETLWTILLHSASSQSAFFFSPPFERSSAFSQGRDQKVSDSCSPCDHSRFAISKVATAPGLDFTINKPTEQTWISMTCLITSSLTHPLSEFSMLPRCQPMTGAG